MSATDQRRRAWCRRHRAHVHTLQRQLTRRPPYRYQTVWCVDWISKVDGSEVTAWCDWGMPTRRQAVDKATRQEAQYRRSGDRLPSACSLRPGADRRHRKINS